MKNTKQILSVFLALIMIISIIPMSTITAFAEDSATSGTCGDNLTWIFDESTGTLTISGTGAMYDYLNSDGSVSARPWPKNTETEIKTVIINDGVTTVGSGAFYCGWTIENIILGNSITIIGDWAFGKCEVLKSITIPDVVTTIGESAFSYCENLSEFTIPESLTTIGNFAFVGCPGLSSLTIPENVSSIGAYAFYGWSNLTHVTIGNNVSTIGDYAFACCYSLTNFIFSDSVTTTGNYAFACCYSLTSVIIPDSVTTIGMYAFYDCYNLTSITVDSNNQYYSSDKYGVLFNKDKTILIQYPIGNTRTSYIIPDSVTTIDMAAFSRSKNLLNVTIPASVITIVSSAFNECTALTDVYFYGTEDEWNAITIGEDNDPLLNATIHFNCHTHNYKTVITPPTCTEQGYTTCTCSCGDSYVDDYTEALGHEYTGEITKPATHTENGVMTYTCVRCNNTYTETIPASDAHSYETEVTPPTCTEQGYTTYTCSCGDSYVNDYTESSGHNKTTIVLSVATCKQQGMQYDYCENCGETLSDIITIPKADHILGNWEITVKATTDTAGEKVQKCTVCGDVINRETIPATGNNDSNDKETVIHKETGVQIEYTKDKYDGEVDIIVEETLDDTALNLVDTKTNASNCKIFDITMTLDGIKTQPNGTVTVRIPLPDGFNPETSYVMYINTATGTVEKMPATYEDGYMVFETTHFSYYAIIEEYNYTLSIQEPSRTEIRNKDGIVLHANVEGTSPTGSYVVWTSNNDNFDEDADGNDLTVIAKDKGYTTFTATLYDADDNVLATDSIELYSKSGFFDKIGGFFRSLFGSTKIYEN